MCVICAKEFSLTHNYFSAYFFFFFFFFFFFSEEDAKRAGEIELRASILSKLATHPLTCNQFKHESILGYITDDLPRKLHVALKWLRHLILREWREGAPESGIGTGSANSSNTNIAKSNIHKQPDSSVAPMDTSDDEKDDVMPKNDSSKSPKNPLQSSATEHAEDYADVNATNTNADADADAFFPSYTDALQHILYTLKTKPMWDSVFTEFVLQLPVITDDVLNTISVILQFIVMDIVILSMHPIST